MCQSRFRQRRTVDRCTCNEGFIIVTWPNGIAAPARGLWKVFVSRAATQGGKEEVSGKEQGETGTCQDEWDLYDRLHPTSPAAPNSRDESGLQVKLSLLAQSWTLSPGTGAGGAVGQAPARISRRASRGQRHGWAEGLQVPCSHSPSQPENNCYSFTLQVWHVNALRDD